MREARAFTYGIALGAGVMFLMDPRQGGARRARIRDKSVRAVHELETAAAIGARDITHRAEGLVHRLRSYNKDVDVPDDVLVERVRAVLGHVCSHPHAIQVVAKGDRCIELKGPVLSAELDDVLSAVSRVPGVETIDNDLEPHETSENVPALQGGIVRRRKMRVSPGTKLIGGSIAAMFALASLFRGHPVGFLIGGITALAFARSVNARGSWQPLRMLDRRRRRPRALSQPREKQEQQQQTQDLSETPVATI